MLYDSDDANLKGEHSHANVNLHTQVYYILAGSCYFSRNSLFSVVGNSTNGNFLVLKLMNESVLLLGYRLYAYCVVKDHARGKYLEALWLIQ